MVSEAIDGDPTATEVATSCLDFLLIELVPMAYRITADLAAKEQEYLSGPGASKASQQAAEKKDIDNDASSTVAGGGGLRGGGTATVVDEEEAREAVFHRLEALGYRVGLGVVERYDYPLRVTTPVLPPCDSVANGIPQSLKNTPPTHVPARNYKVPLQRPLDPPLPQTNR